MTEPIQHISDLLKELEDPKPPTIRQMLYRIIHLLVMRVELRVEAKTKAVFREVHSAHDAVRTKH